MTRISVLIFVLSLITMRCSGNTEHASDKDLADLKKMKGVAVSTREGERAETFFFGSRNTDLVSFSIGWLAENELLGRGVIEEYRKLREQQRKDATPEQLKRGGSADPQLMYVELFGTDRTGRTVFVSRLDARPISGGELTDQFGGELHNVIEFSLDRQLIEHSFLRFWEYDGGHGSQYTDVYLGRKPAPPPKIPETPVSAAQSLPGLELPGAR